MRLFVCLFVSDYLCWFVGYVSLCIEVGHAMLLKLAGCNICIYMGIISTYIPTQHNSLWLFIHTNTHNSMWLYTPTIAVGINVRSKEQNPSRMKKLIGYVVVSCAECCSVQLHCTLYMV